MSDKLKTELKVLEEAHDTTRETLNEVRQDVKEMREQLAKMPAELKLAINESCVTRQEFRAVKAVAGVVASIISITVGALYKLLGN